jgi:hypothetical protein
MKNILYKTFILVFLFSTSVLAKEWEIVDFDKFVSLQYHGKVTHGDKLDFNFSKKNCDRVNYFFSIYTAKKNPDFMNLKGKPIPLNINGVKTSANTIYTSPFLMGYRGMFYLGSYHAKDISKFFNRITSYQIKVVDRDNFKADAYFDIDFNQWNLGDSEEAFKEAYSVCKSKVS